MKGKQKIVVFRVSEEEGKQLTEDADARGLTESAYLRLLIRQKPKDYPEVKDQLKTLINEVNHIGVNINQITKNHNSSLYLEEDKRRLFAYMKKLNLAVKDVVKELGD